MCLYALCKVCKSCLDSKIKLHKETENVVDCIIVKVCNNVLKSCKLCKKLILYSSADALKRANHLLKKLDLTVNGALDLLDHTIYYALKLFKLLSNGAVDASCNLGNGALKLLECLCEILESNLAGLYELYNLIKKLNCLVICRGKLLKKLVVDIGVLKESLNVNRNEIPNKVTVDCVPLSECGKDYVCIIKNEAYDLLAVVLCDEAKNCEYRHTVYCKEVNDLVTVCNEELNNGLGIVVEPVVKCLCSLVAVVSSRSNELLYKSLVYFGCFLDKIEIEFNNVFDLGNYKCLKLICKDLYLTKNKCVDLLETCNKLCSVIVCDDLKSDYKVVKRLNVKKENLVKLHSLLIGLFVKLICNLDKCDKTIDVHQYSVKLSIDKADESSVLFVKVLCIELFLECNYLILKLVECIDDLYNITVCVELCVCILVCLIVVLGNQINNIFNSLLQRSVLVLVRILNCRKYRIVTFLRGVTADTGTDYNACVHAKNTGGGRICKNCIAESLRKSKEVAEVIRTANCILQAINVADNALELVNAVYCSPQLVYAGYCGQDGSFVFFGNTDKGSLIRSLYRLATSVVTSALGTS